LAERSDHKATPVRRDLRGTRDQPDRRAVLVCRVRRGRFLRVICPLARPCEALTA
jgi:hypothetical protein